MRPIRYNSVSIFKLQIELKLILAVYEPFTYPSREGRARSVARSCDMQAVSLFYLQTTYLYIYKINKLYISF